MRDIPAARQITGTQADLLLIDDSQTDLRLLIEMMAGHHLRVSIALDGEKGYQQAVLQQPDLILLDIRMPVMDGFATCRRLKANPVTQNIPVIFLTVENDLKDRLEGFALGAVDYIRKPFSEAEVLARIGVHLQLMPKPTPAGEMADDVTRDGMLVQAIQKIMLELIATPPSLEELAQMLGVNPRRISKAFQLCCGQSAFGWLREERLRQAHHLICRTDTPISSISEHLGYSTPANFAKAFRERFGFPPSDLRRQMRIARQEAGEVS